MQKFNDLIRETRKLLGFSSAKEFHRSKNDVISMGYESYANIEAGKYLPPAEKLTGLAEALEIEDIKAFVFSYCYTMMPNDLFQSLFDLDRGGSGPNPMILRNDSYTSYKEKFHALLRLNRLHERYELSEGQIQYLETDLVSWDIINLFIASGDEGFTLEQIAEKTDSGVESTRTRISDLIRLSMLKQLESGRYLVTQDAFFIPRRPLAMKLAHLLMRRELDQSFNDKRNTPYCRFRFMPIDPTDREHIETFIDNFILDSRQFKKSAGGKTHYLHVFFSNREDLS